MALAICARPPNCETIPCSVEAGLLPPASALRSVAIMASMFVLSPGRPAAVLEAAIRDGLASSVGSS